jgi:hypothetical protein
MPPGSQTLSRDQYAPLGEKESILLQRQTQEKAGVAGVQELQNGNLVRGNAENAERSTVNG